MTPCVVPTVAAGGAGAIAGLGAAALGGCGTELVAGASAATLEVPAGAVPLGWSADGRWLALVVPGSDRATAALWLAPAGGGTAAPVEGLVGPHFGMAAWSPTADVLAVVLQNGSGILGSPAMWLVTPGQPARDLLSAPALGDALWSPDGSTIAYTTTPAQTGSTAPGDVLATVAVQTGRVTHRYQAPAPQQLEIAGWWPGGGGLLFWDIPLRSASLDNGSWPLRSLAAGATTPSTLTETPFGMDPTARPVGDEIALVAGQGRGSRSDRTLELCVPGAGTCHAAGQPAGTVALDPTWSPDGRWLAFVCAKDTGSTGEFATLSEVMAWEATARLCVMDMATGATTVLTGAGGAVESPSWARDGRHILYQSGDGLYVADMAHPAGPGVPVGSGGSIAVWPDPPGQRLDLTPAG